MKSILNVFLVLSFYLLAGCAIKKTPNDISISAVAGQFIQELYEDHLFELFVFSLPAQAVVPDHTTGPRVLVFLTDLKANRLDDGDEIQVAKDQALYLTNDFSKGFVNSANEAAYLVLGFKQGGMMKSDDSHCPSQGLVPLFTQGGVLICKSEQAQTLKFKDKTLVYNPNQSELNIAKADDVVLLNQGDLIFNLQGL